MYIRLVKSLGWFAKRQITKHRNPKPLIYIYKGYIFLKTMQIADLLKKKPNID